MRAKEIILLILIILIGVTLSLFHSGRLQWLNFDWQELLSSGEQFDFEETRIIEPPLPEWLAITNPRGEVIVDEGKTENIEIYWEKQVWAKKEEEAQTKAKQMELLILKDDPEVRISPSLPQKIKMNYRSNIRIMAPSFLSLKIDNARGRVRVNGFKQAQINNSHGQVTVDNLSSDLYVKNRHGDLNVTEIAGLGEIICEHGNLVISRAMKAVKIKARHGQLDIDDVAGSLEIAAEHFSIRGRKIRGPISISTSYEPVDLKEIGQAEINNRYGLIRIEGTVGNLTIQNRYSTVDLTNLEGNLQISGKYVRISGRLIRSQTIDISTAYDNVELKDFSGQTTISLRHGNCSLEPASLQAGLKYEGKYGSCRLLWPAQEILPTEIRVRHGQILWQLEAPTTQYESDGETVIRAFSLEHETPSIFINHSYGNVVVEKAISLTDRKKPISP